MDTRIYIMAHKAFEVPKVEGYLPMQVGREGKTDLGYLCDNTGVNISEKNASYCELTGLYWIWKNVDCDIAGLCHYRRYFVYPKSESLHIEQRLLAKEDIERSLAEYDLIAPSSGMRQEGSVLAHYVQHHHATDWQECGRVIIERCPQYYQAFDWSQRCNLISLGNMVIARKDVLDSYCEWLFDILFEVEKRIDTSSYDEYQKRVFGFLSERLFRVYMLQNGLRVREEQTIVYENENIYNDTSKVPMPRG